MDRIFQYRKARNIRLEKADAEIKREIVRRFIYLREWLISDYRADYIIIDASPGLRFWSINSLAIADILLLTLRMGSLDIEGTRTTVNEIYKSFTKFGSKAYLLYNLKAGYCVPSTGAAKLNPLKDPPQNEVDEELSSELGVPVITDIHATVTSSSQRERIFYRPQLPPTSIYKTN